MPTPTLMLPTKEQEETIQFIQAKIKASAADATAKKLLVKK